MLLGSTSVKAASRTFVKLTIDVLLNNIAIKKILLLLDILLSRISISQSKILSKSKQFSHITFRNIVCQNIQCD